jgi:hypothetical protein
MSYGHIEELRYTGQGGGGVTGRSTDEARRDRDPPMRSDEGIAGFAAGGLGATKDARIGTRTSRLRDREGDNGDG